MEMRKSIPLTYYVCKANGWKLWKDALDKRGWQQLPFDYKFTTSYGLKYVEGRGQIDYKVLFTHEKEKNYFLCQQYTASEPALLLQAHTSGQLVCHIPNNNVITTKMELLQTMREAYR